MWLTRDPSSYGRTAGFERYRKLVADWFSHSTPTDHIIVEHCSFIGYNYVMMSLLGMTYFVHYVTFVQ